MRLAEQSKVRSLWRFAQHLTPGPGIPKMVSPEAVVLDPAAIDLFARWILQDMRLGSRSMNG